MLVTEAAVRPQQIRDAVRALERGELVGLPTETVYGLAADAENDDAVRRIYAAKGRPADHPVIVHVHRRADPLRWASRVPEAAKRLIEAFWPGPLTLVLPRREGVAAACAAGQDTIALRCPDHPVAQAVLALLHGGQGGVAAPSANRFGRVSPTTAQHVREEFGAELALVLDGGPCAIGIESTIVDCSGETPRILRPGGLSAELIAEVLGVDAAQLRPDSGERAPRVPGALAAHYAPATPVRVVPAPSIAQDWDRQPRVAVLARSPAPPAAQARWRELPPDAAGFAQGLYAALRELDALGLDAIWVEEPPPLPQWDAVRDRLRRAAASA